MFFNFLAEFELLMFHNNTVKLQIKINNRNLLEPWLQVTTLQTFA